MTNFWAGKRVFVTGHSGFKGAWLSLRLKHLGAEVLGFSLGKAEPFATLCGFQAGVPEATGDVRDYRRLLEVMKEFRPQVIFHLAAQALVRRSYEEPLFTFAANVMGTANLLEAVRAVGGVGAVVIVTTDKCYEDRQWPWAYRENDRLGGHDPYSASKACAEMVTAAFRSSYFAGAEGPAVATARAGNVIGGGDWSADRLLPDIARAFILGKTAQIRSPKAVRPWQHVLEAVGGYLQLAEALYGNKNFAGSWNFGPPLGTDSHTVEWVVKNFTAAWGRGAAWAVSEDPEPHETEVLRLDSSKARQELGWRGTLPTRAAIRLAAEWYRRLAAGEDPLAVVEEQLAAYVASSDGKKLFASGQKGS